MDGARERIAELAGTGTISAAEHDILLASFLLSADGWRTPWGSTMRF